MYTQLCSNSIPVMTRCITNFMFRLISDSHDYIPIMAVISQYCWSILRFFILFPLNSEVQAKLVPLKSARRELQQRSQAQMPLGTRGERLVWHIKTQ